MNDWLDKGSGSNRYYLSHGIFTPSLEQQQAIADYNELCGLYNRCNSIYKSINQRFITETEKWGRLNRSQPILDKVKEFHSLCNSYESAFTLGKRFYEEAQRRKEKLDAIHSSKTEHLNQLRRGNDLSKIGRNKK